MNLSPWIATISTLNGVSSRYGREKHRRQKFLKRRKQNVREVKILQPARKTLLEQKKLTFSANQNSPVFINPNTREAWTGDQQIRNAWMPIFEIANVRYRNPYQTWHTYASMMLSAGKTPVWLSGQMGHINVNMIYKIYVRWIPDAATNAGQKAVGIFG